LKAELEKAGASSGFLSKVEEQFSKLLSQASGSRSIAHIQQTKVAAEQAYDQALTEMERAVNPVKPVAVPASGGAEGTVEAPIKPKMKTRRVVDVRSLSPSEFIETAEEMEDFLEALRAKLQGILDAGERAQLK
jgi:hypothetical protein